VGLTLLSTFALIVRTPCRQWTMNTLVSSSSSPSCNHHSTSSRSAHFKLGDVFLSRAQLSEYQHLHIFKVHHGSVSASPLKVTGGEAAGRRGRRHLVGESMDQTEYPTGLVDIDPSAPVTSAYQGCFQIAGRVMEAGSQERVS
jgi:hypothetical protein